MAKSKSKESPSKELPSKYKAKREPVTLLPVSKDWQRHWRGMPEFVSRQQEPFATVLVRLRSQEDLDAFAELIGHKFSRKSKTMYRAWYPKLQVGMGDVGLSKTKRYVDES